MGQQPRKWSVLQVLRDTLARIRERPWSALLLLGIVPAIWELPRTLPWYRDLTTRSEFSNPDQAGAYFAVVVVGAAWSAIIWGGQVLISLDLARQKRVSVRRFFDGIRHAPRIFIVVLATTLPMSLAGFTADLMRRAPSLLLLDIVLVVLMFFILLRGVIWVPLMVDRRMSLVRAFRTSWSSTRGASWRIAALYSLGALVSVPLAMLTLERPMLLWAANIFISPVALTLFAVLYLGLAPNSDASNGAPPSSPSSPNEPAPPHADLPLRGTGWTRSIRSDE